MKVLSIEQMHQLKELGVDTSKASMCYVFFESDGNKYEKLVVHNEDCYEFASLNPIPTFTLQDVIELLPCEIFTSRSNFYLNITKFDGNSYTISYEIQLQDGSIEEIILPADDILECSYQMLIWVIENGHLKTK